MPTASGERDRRPAGSGQGGTPTCATALDQSTRSLIARSIHSSRSLIRGRSTPPVIATGRQTVRELSDPAHRLVTSATGTRLARRTKPDRSGKTRRYALSVQVCEPQGGLVTSARAGCPPRPLGDGHNAQSQPHERLRREPGITRAWHSRCDGLPRPAVARSVMDHCGHRRGRARADAAAPLRSGAFSRLWEQQEAQVSGPQRDFAINAARH
jgi:hypothetical protein